MAAVLKGVPRRPGLLHALIILVAIPFATLSAQTLSTAPGSAPAAAAGSGDGSSEITLLVGRSTIVEVGAPIARVSLSQPEVADALVTASQQLLVHGKAPGTISMFVWERAGGIRRFEVVVRRDLSQLVNQLQQLFPGDELTVSGSGSDVVLSGVVGSQYVIDKAADVAAGYVEKRENVVNLLRKQEAETSNQVLLRVRFAEVSRSALQELGASFFTGATGYEDYVARMTTQQFAAPTFDDGRTVFSDFLNLFLFNTNYNIGTVIKAMQMRGLFQSLAEPNLIAENGKEASFLAGGEYPYPAVQGSGANLAVTISFKEFGIRLNFTPTVLPGDFVHLKVRPEVSSLDFNNAVTLQGFRVPSLITRRAETEVELRDGQTFAIAGLMNNSITSSMNKIPGIGDIPILGLLFRSKAAQKAQTELVVMITPQIIRRNSTGAAAGLPEMIEPFMPPPAKTLPPPPPHPQRRDEPEPAASAPAAPATTPTAAAKVSTPQFASRDGAAIAAAPVQNAAAPLTVAAVEPVRQVDGAAPAAAFADPPGPGGTAVAGPPAAAAAPKPGTAVAPAPVAAPATPPPPTKEEKAALERARKELKKQQEVAAAAERKEEERLRKEEERAAKEEAKARAAEEKARAADEKRAAEQAKVEQRKAEEARKKQEKADAEQAKRDAEAAKKAAEAAKKQAAVESQRQQVLSEAEQRLRSAQQAYEAALERAQKKGNQPQDAPQQ
jgi:pilus assembly protein CpaC